MTETEDEEEKNAIFVNLKIVFLNGDPISRYINHNGRPNLYLISDKQTHNDPELRSIKYRIIFDEIIPYRKKKIRLIKTM